jgi:hypothetical protein
MADRSMPKVKKAGTEAYDPNLRPQLSPIMKDYIKFHRSATQGGELRKGVKYMIYEYTNASLSGGAGDRIIDMVKALYLAICTNRVLLIDSNFPTPLEDHLLPNLSSGTSRFHPLNQHWMTLTRILSSVNMKILWDTDWADLLG